MIVHSQIIIFVHSLLITEYLLGQPGSTHDSTAFRQTNLYQNHEQLLQAHEWIWGDAAYPLLPWLITPFKVSTLKLSCYKLYH